MELHYYHVANLERKENQGLKKTNAVSFDIAGKTAPSSLVYLQLSKSNDASFAVAKLQFVLSEKTFFSSDWLSS